MHRLLHHEDAPPQLAAERDNSPLMPELAERLEVFEVLVAIQT